jgi:hypothetical protein
MLWGRNNVCCLSGFEMTTGPAGAGRVLVDPLRQGSLASLRADRRRQVAGGGGADADAGQATGGGSRRQRCAARAPMSARVR